MKTKRSKYLLIGLTIFCFVLIIVTSFKDGILEPLRTGVGYVLVPLQTGVNALGNGIYTEYRDYTHLKTALAENERLKEEVAGLIEENNRLQSGQFELNRLRELYQLDQTYMQYDKIGARIIAKDSGDWFQVFRVNKGSADGVEVDNNVIAGGGLVGIVTDVGANYATVRSIIDDSSRVSAMAMQSGDRCIVAGDLTLFEEGRLRITNITKAPRALLVLGNTDFEWLAYQKRRCQRGRSDYYFQYQFKISSRDFNRLCCRCDHGPGAVDQIRLSDSCGGF